MKLPERSEFLVNYTLHEPTFIMLLLTSCEVHTGKYLDRSFEVRTEWSECQHLDKIVLNWIIMTIYTSNSFWSNWIIMTIYTSNSFWSNWIIMTIYTSNSFWSIFIRTFFGIFSNFSISFKEKLSFKNQNLLKKSVSSILSNYWCRPSVFWSNWRSNTALDGLLINQSNRLFISGYTIKLLIGLSMNFNFHKLVIHNINIVIVD